MKKGIKSFNFADFIILLALLVVICGAAFKKPVEKVIDELYSKADITYELEISKEYKNKFEVGSKLYDDKGIYIGSVVEVLVGDNDNTVNLTIETQGKHDNKGNYIGDSMFIAPGKEMDLHLNDKDVVKALVKKVQYDT